jgi:hypothetical protein
VLEGDKEGVEGTEAAAATPLATEVLALVLVGVEVLEFAKAADGVVANGLDANPAIDVGEKEGTEVEGRELVGVLVVKVLGEDEAPVAREGVAAVFVQAPLAVTVTVTLPSAPVEVGDALANAGVKLIGVVVVGVAAEGGGRVFWLNGTDGKVVEVLGTALAGVESGEVDAEELILCS